MKRSKIISALFILLPLLIASSSYGKTTDTVPDKAVLEKFEQVCKKMNDVKGNYTLGGVINIIDRANPADAMDHVGFLFCKQGDEFYYQLGKTITLNEQGVYLYIDNQSRRVMVSPQKKVQYDAGIKQFADMGANIQSEHYKMTSKINGDEQTISLVNERHISCKQYTITFDRQSLKVKYLYMRLTNLNDPLNKANEKIVTVNISKWSNTADVSQYLSKNDVIKNVKGGWRTVSVYRNYELIKM
ncbi:hypothetical protein HDF18_01225 [Mucilaginibacter sp. X5P1]|uniref:hypothetical protein n=1 Tax=Mucilaginibacter sp. X5P1 TaxID=2723088 RepID=UPI00161CA8F8|nr:hypothetical protein [Mucilaginibacter sp. X5P1]MBB6138275.1 hypothetical protein [Mucilaginibacter sp. X5P1]